MVLGPVARPSAGMAAPVFDGFTRRAFLLPRACARAARVFNDVKALPTGFLEVEHSFISSFYRQLLDRSDHIGKVWAP